MNLYQKYHGRVLFVVVNLDLRLSSAQQELVQKYFRGFIPHIVVLDSAGNLVYNRSGEVEEPVISTALERILK